MWKQLISEEIQLGGEQATRRTNACYARSPSKGGLDGRPYGVAEECSRAGGRRRLAGRTRVLRSAASSQNQAPRGTKAFHATKDCSGYTGKVGALLHDQVLERQGIKAGSKIFYFQADSKTGTDSDIVIYVGPGTVATGHCLLHFATGLGLCTISDGTGTLAGFHARVRVTARFVDPEAVALGRDVQLQ